MLCCAWESSCLVAMVCVREADVGVVAFAVLVAPWLAGQCSMSLDTDPRAVRRVSGQYVWEPLDMGGNQPMCVGTSQMCVGTSVCEWCEQEAPSPPARAVHPPPPL